MKLSIQAASAVVEAKPKTDLVLIPGGKGKATQMKKGDLIKVINTHGKQVSNIKEMSVGPYLYLSCH